MCEFSLEVEHFRLIDLVPKLFIDEGLVMALL